MQATTPGTARVIPPPRTIVIWALVLLAGATLLYGRYDWELEGGRFADRGFVLSTYLFVVLLPTCFYLARRLLHDTRAAFGLTAAVLVVTTLPYHVLGLESIYYYRVRPQVYRISDALPASLEFFPEGTLRAFPYDWLFIPLLFVAGLGLIWGVWEVRNRAGHASPRLIPILLTIAFATICAQTYVHSSMRAPYTYLAYFQKPKAKEHWYHVYHFADGSGATEADQFAFSPLEDYFHGAPRDGDNELIRRPMSFFMAAQVSYFVNTFYVWLALNCLFWLVAVLATARLVTRLAGERAGRIAGALVTVGPGFVAFAATPAMYLQGYVAVVVALCLFEELIVGAQRRTPEGFALFGGVLALCALVYDITPLFVVLGAYGFMRKVPMKPLLVTLVAALIVARGFTVMVTAVLGIEIVPTNARQLSRALDGFQEFLLHPSFHDWYEVGAMTISTYVRLLLQAFFVVPVLVACLGIRKLKDPSHRVLVGGLLLMGFGVIAVLQIGGESNLVIPRLLYAVFPAVYLLAALALDGGLEPRYAGSNRRLHVLADRVRPLAPWLLVGVMAFVANFDVFGHPTQYVEFFVSTPPKFLPR